MVTLNEEIRKNEMYVAASRALANLVIVGPNKLVERFKVSTLKFRSSRCCMFI
jgi:hypothetical protein